MVVPLRLVHSVEKVDKLSARRRDRDTAGECGSLDTTIPYDTQSHRSNII